MRRLGYLAASLTLAATYVGGVLHGRLGGVLPRQIAGLAARVGLAPASRETDGRAHEKGDAHGGLHGSTSTSSRSPDRHDNHDDHDHDDQDHDDQDHDDHDHDDHDDHDHAVETPADPDEGRHDHEEEASLDLSPAALANLGLTKEMIRPISATTYVRHITVPAMVVERPGRTQLPVSAPMTGVVTHVHAVTGEAVTPGTLLFQLRLTHEDLVTAQTEFLQVVENLDVEAKEIARLDAASQSGALPGRVLLERQYSRDKLLASLKSSREALRLHGLSPGQIDRIEQERRLLTEIKVFAPGPDDHDHGHEHEHDDELQLSDRLLIRQTAFLHNEGDSSDTPHSAAHGTAQGAQPTPLVIQSLMVHKGSTVATGDVLCVLGDYAELAIEGQAFETDAAAIAEAKRRGWLGTAVVEQSGVESEVTQLKIAYLSNEVDRDARTLDVYVALPNELTEDSRNDEGQRFVVWKYRPGQRMLLRVPVEEWTEQFVVPIDAVVREGPNSYVFVQHSDHFDRISIHEKFRDRSSVVVANDRALLPGDRVALTGAHQLQLALKNKAGDGLDPHAGHSH